MGIRNNPGKFNFEKFFNINFLTPLAKILNRLTNVEEHLTEDNNLIVKACNNELSNNKQNYTSNTSYDIGEKTAEKNVSAIITSSANPLTIG